MRVAASIGILAFGLVLAAGPTGAASLSCVGPPADVIGAIIDGRLGPSDDDLAHDGWMLGRVVASRPTADGVEVELDVLATARSRTPLPVRVVVHGERDPFGSEVPLSDAAPGERWVVPLRQTGDRFLVTICDVRARVDHAEAQRFARGGDPLIARGVAPPQPTHAESDTSRAPIAIATGLAIAAATAAGVAIGRRTVGT